MRRILFLMGMAGISISCHAQIDSRELHQAFDSFRKEIHEDFDDYRKQIVQNYLEFLSNPWKEFAAEEPIPMPKEDTIPPVVQPVIPEEEDKPIEDKPVVIEDVIVPEPVAPQPQPVQPIEEVPVIEEKTVSVSFFGTQCKVRIPIDCQFHVEGVSPKKVAKAFETIATEEYDNLIYDCLEIRSRLQLCDWAYLELLRMVADQICQKGSNESELLMAYIFIQSGYRMRLATDGQRLYMLFATHHILYDRPYYALDGENYCCLSALPNNLNITEAAFENEKNLSMLILQPMQLTDALSNIREIQSKKYTEMQVSCHVNKNLMDFYNTYPSSQYGENFMTRWATYAATPIQETIRKELYPQLKSSIKGESQLGAVGKLLNWIQTGFVYEYDDKVWGGDRAFFPEETLYYPYCDCEDRSILLSRLVRDLLGLDVILVYYPGHLAAAIGFTEQVTGDYIMLNGKKYVIADPTFIGAPVGKTMSGMDNKSAKVILL